MSLMRDIAFEGNGRFYFVEEPTEVPRIFTEGEPRREREREELDVPDFLK